MLYENIEPNLGAKFKSLRNTAAEVWTILWVHSYKIVNIFSPISIFFNNIGNFAVQIFFIKNIWLKLYALALF